MTASITNLYGNVNHCMDLNTDSVLEALIGKTKVLFICGYHADGTFFIDSSTSDRGAFLMAMQVAARLLVDMELDMDECEPLHPDED